MDDIKDIKAKYQPFTQYPPDCCASCEYLADDGRCRHHGPVPLEFIEQKNDCPDFLPRIPF